MEKEKLKQLDKEREKQVKQEYEERLKLSEKEAMDIIKSTVKEQQRGKFVCEKFEKVKFDYLILYFRNLKMRIQMIPMADHLLLKFQCNSLKKNWYIHNEINF